MSEPMSSAIEDNMMDLYHKAYKDGELLEKPLGSAGDMKIWIGIQPWSNGLETFTIPDFNFKEAFHLIYLDGHPHYSRTRSKRDEIVKAILEDMGYTVQRFPYKKNTKGVRLFILNSTIEKVNSKLKGVRV